MFNLSDLDNLVPGAELFETLNMRSIVGSRLRGECTIRGVVVNSIVQAGTVVEPSSIMDTCLVEVPVHVEGRTILSQCVIDDPDIKTIPSGWLFHTAALDGGERSWYVTVAFRVDDDLKGETRDSQSWMDLGGVPPTTSLWEARLFAAEATRSESFKATWRLVTDRHRTATSDVALYSQADVVQNKCIASMLHHRNQIERMKRILDEQS